MATNSALRRALHSVHLTAHEENLLFASRNVIVHLATPLVTRMGIAEKYSERVQFLDLACGTGIVTDIVQKRVLPEALSRSTFRATDASEVMLGMTKKRVELEGWTNVETEVMDAKDMKYPDASFTHVAAALALHIIPEPDQVVKESMRVLKPGGVFGATTFAEANSNKWFAPDLDRAFRSLPFETPSLLPAKMQIHDDGRWTDASWVESNLKNLGLVDVTAEEVSGTYHFKDAEEWMKVFEVMIMWTINSRWDEEIRKKMSVGEVKERVLEHLKERYNEEGWDVDWTVIVMTGRVPSLN